MLSRLFGTYKLMKVEGESMIYQYAPGSILLIQKVSKENYSLLRGEIIVCCPPALQGKAIIKRVIGLPTEHLRVTKAGDVLVNGFKIHEPYVKLLKKEIVDYEWQLNAHQIFILGDNRQNSLDSRKFGPLSVDSVTGKIKRKIWPLNHS